MRKRAWLLLLSALLALAGCGLGSPPPPTTTTGPTTGGTTPVSTPSLTTPISTPSPKAPAEPPTATDLITYVQAGNPVGIATYDSGGQASFSTPSGNISCGLSTVGGGTVLCFVDENSWPSVPAQACNDFGDWTDHSVVAFTDGARRGGCFSEAPYPMPGSVLPYGSMISNGSVACRSESWFLACVHLSTHNGFVISKAVLHPYGTLLPSEGN
jgi:hypothetical protein